MLIYLTGPVGSGKTTICEKIATKYADILDKKLFVIDFDDIIAKIINKVHAKLKKPLTNPKEINKYHNGITNKFNKILHKYEKISKKSNVCVIFSGNYYKFHNVTHGFVIKQSSETIFRRLNKRLLNAILKSKQEIIHALNDMNAHQCLDNIIYKYKVQGQFPQSIYDADRMIYNKKVEATNQGYLYAGTETIYKKISALISKF